MSILYYVSRQCNTYEGTYYVEIAIGGLDYSNPGALISPKGEYNYEGPDPREAVACAIEMRDNWRKVRPDVDIFYGNTWGSTRFFDDEQEPLTDEELKAWADSRWDDLPKCCVCADLLPEDYYYYEEDDPDLRMCSDICVDRYVRDNYDYCEKCRCDVPKDQDDNGNLVSTVTEIHGQNVCECCQEDYERCEGCGDWLEEGRIGRCDDCWVENDEEEFDEEEFDEEEIIDA